MFMQFLGNKGYVGTLSDRLRAAAVASDLFGGTGYALRDDGTNAALFGYERLPLIDGIYGTYEYTGAARTLVALPQDISAAPGLVPLVEGQTRVCAFGIDDITPGNIPNFNFSVYNPSGSKLFNAQVQVDDGATTGRIKLESGTFPGSMTTSDTYYEGELVGAGVTLALTYASGQITCTMYVTDSLYLAGVGGHPVATSAAVAATGGVFADILVYDEVGATGSISININPSVPVLSDNFGNFPSGSVDMDGTAITPSGVFSPLSLTGTLDLWHWRDTRKIWTTDARTTNSTNVADPVGAWRGYLNQYILSTPTASNRLEMSATGVLINSASVFKELTLARAVANNTPLTVMMRFVGTSGQHPRFAGYVGSTASTGITAGTTILGRARTGTAFNSTYSASGDNCVVVSFDGTSAYIKVNGNAAQTITVGTDATDRDTIKLTALLAAATVANVKYLQVVGAAVSSTDAAKWITWASAQP
jgi:hypothetical protein